MDLKWGSGVSEESTRRHIPKDRNLQSHRSGSLKFHRAGVINCNYIFTVVSKVFQDVTPCCLADGILQNVSTYFQTHSIT